MENSRVKKILTWVPVAGLALQAGSMVVTAASDKQPTCDAGSHNTARHCDSQPRPLPPLVPLLGLKVTSTTTSSANSFTPINMTK